MIAFWSKFEVIFLLHGKVRHYFTSTLLKLIPFIYFSCTGTKILLLLSLLVNTSLGADLSPEQCQVKWKNCMGN